MVALDVGGAGTAAGLHHVRVQGALDQVIHLLAFQHAGNSALERADELRADGLALRLRLGHAGELVQERLALVHGDQLRAGGGHEIGLHLLALALAQQAVVHEHAGEAVADGALHQRRRDSGIHATGQGANGAALADLLAHVRDQLLGDVGGGPVLLQAGDVGEEAGEHLLAVRGVHDLRVVLHAGELAGGVLERGHRRARGGGGDLEALRRLRDGVAVGHPHGVLGLESGVEHAAVDTHLRAAVLARTGLGHLAAERAGHDLEAVANAEDRQPQLEDLLVELRRALCVHRRRAAGENQRLRVLLADFCGGDGGRNHLGENVRLAHTAGDQLRVLRAEIEDKDWAGLRSIHRPRS